MGGEEGRETEQRGREGGREIEQRICLRVKLDINILVEN